MAILKVARLGHPILRQIAQPVPPEAILAPQIQTFIDDLIETMFEYDGAGLAAPQVHVSQQIVAFAVDGNPRYPDADSIPLTVLINPVIRPATKEMDEDWEGCLSIPDIRGMVPRHTDILVKALDRDGKPLELRLKNFAARVAQHETDHLDGILFFDRMKAMQSLTFLEEYSRYHAKDED